MTPSVHPSPTLPPPKISISINTNKLQPGIANPGATNWHHTTSGTNQSASTTAIITSTYHSNSIAATPPSPPLHCQTTYIAHVDEIQYNHSTKRKSLHSPETKFSWNVIHKWYTIQIISEESEIKIHLHQ